MRLIDNYNACQKSWNTSANFALFCDFPLSPLEKCCFVVRKSGCQDDARLCWNGRTITFEINIVSGARGYLNLIIMVRSADYEETAYVFQGLLAGIVDDRQVYEEVEVDPMVDLGKTINSRLNELREEDPGIEAVTELRILS